MDQRSNIKIRNLGQLGLYQWINVRINVTKMGLGITKFIN